MSDVTVLRTLTLKSKIKFGIHHDRTVGDLLIMRKQFEVARMYYRLDRISFDDEVLSLVGITNELKINKPGKVDRIPDAVVYSINAIESAAMTEVERLAAYQRKRSHNKGIAKSLIKAMNESNGKLQSRNHGR